MSAWYNEIDPQKAAWLRELIKGNYILDYLKGIET